jgi:DNA-binding MarR family transcriptional regulator
MAFRLVIVLATQLRALMDRRLSSSDLTTQQAALLSVALAAEAPPTQGELAAALGVSHQNVRQLTASLERKGFLGIEADPEDRRVKRFAPTKTVKSLFARRNTEDFAAVASWFSNLDSREVTTLVELLARLSGSIAEERARDART